MPRLEVRCSEAEKEAWLVAAGEAGLSEWIRALANKASPFVSVTVKVPAELEDPASFVREAVRAALENPRSTFGADARKSPSAAQGIGEKIPTPATSGAEKIPKESPAEARGNPQEIPGLPPAEIPRESPAGRQEIPELAAGVICRRQGCDRERDGASPFCSSHRVDP